MDCDTMLAVATLWQEARGVADDNAVLGVCHVIRNRMAKRYSSDGTVPGTVLAPYQFSGWNPGSLVASESLRAVPDAARLLSLWVRSAATLDNTGGAVLYYSPDAMGDRSPPTWANESRFTITIGPFDFYRA